MPHYPVFGRDPFARPNRNPRPNGNVRFVRIQIKMVRVVNSRFSTFWPGKDVTKFDIL